MSLPNIWHLRRVADTAGKACYICYKPSTSVLITPDNKDFFYVCPSHLKDKNFCSAIVDAEDQAAKKKQEAMAREIEQVKKEYEEKQQKKKQKQKQNDKDKDKASDGGKDADKKPDSGDKSDEKERDDKVKPQPDSRLSLFSPRVASYPPAY
ncbi:VPS4-associated protein 1 [Aspergillus ambiguus]|uniref:AAA-ATPase Vps4-associated 1 family protein n=1 Tax=Aspergillus ambiguus TaxID=176160 RepID=UPI003CCD2EAD